VSGSAEAGSEVFGRAAGSGEWPWRRALMERRPTIVRPKPDQAEDEGEAGV
jgi:hypothetical protein